MCPGECIEQKKVLPPKTIETTPSITEEGSAVIWIAQDLSLNDVTQGCHSSWLREQGGGAGAPLPLCGTFTGWLWLDFRTHFLDVLCQGELCSYQVSTTQFMVGQLRAACLREKLPSDRATRIAWDAGRVGDA